MDGLVERLKDSLNSIEDRFKTEEGATFYTKMMNYFLISKDTANILENALNVTEDEEAGDDDDDAVSLEDSDLEDDISTTSSIDEDDNDNDDKCGSVLEQVWKKRSKALRTDIAISGWMCSPNPEVMRDCLKNHTGEHRTAVTRLLRRWYIHEVKHFDFVHFRFCYS
jgi:hypothetical protein